MNGNLVITIGRECGSGYRIRRRNPGERRTGLRIRQRAGEGRAEGGAGTGRSAGTKDPVPTGR